MPISDYKRESVFVKRMKNDDIAPRKGSTTRDRPDTRARGRAVAHGMRALMTRACDSNPNRSNAANCQQNHLQPRSCQSCVSPQSMSVRVCTHSRSTRPPHSRYMRPVVLHRAAEAQARERKVPLEQYWLSLLVLLVCYFESGVASRELALLPSKHSMHRICVWVCTKCFAEKAASALLKLVSADSA